MGWSSKYPPFPSILLAAKFFTALRLPERCKWSNLVFDFKLPDDEWCRLELKNMYLGRGHLNIVFFCPDVCLSSAAVLAHRCEKSHKSYFLLLWNSCSNPKVLQTQRWNGRKLCFFLNTILAWCFRFLRKESTPKSMAFPGAETGGLQFSTNEMDGSLIIASVFPSVGKWGSRRWSNHSGRYGFLCERNEKGNSNHIKTFTFFFCIAIN